MATASRHLCWSIWQISKITPAKRKCLVQPLPHRRPLARQFTTSRPWRSDEPRSSDPPQAPESTEAAAAGGQVPAEEITVDDKAIKPEEDNETPTRAASAGDNHELEIGDMKLVLESHSAPTNSSEYSKPTNPMTAADLNPQDRAVYDSLSREEQNNFMALQNHYKAVFDVDEFDDEEIGQSIDSADRILERENPVEIPHAQVRDRDLGFWGDDEEDEFSRVEDDDDDWDESMITSVAESQLELHREIRQYMRVTAWDMPLLSKFAKPFSPPTYATPLRFRYTTYMGEAHPAQKKVVVEFSTQDLQQSISLTEQQRIKLIKLVGVRYNPSTDTVRMSCEKFEHAAQNKRYLGDLVDKLVTEAKDATDTLEDIPLDFRHHKEKKKPLFPEEWKMTSQRVQELDSLRKAPLKELVAATEQAQAQSAEENDQQRRVAEYVAAMPLGRREPRDSFSR